MSGLSQWSTLLEDEAAQVRAGTVRPLLDRRPAGRFLLLDTEPPSRAGDRAAAYDKLLDRKVMLQFLDREGAASTLGEAAAMARLSHPNLIKVHDVGVLDGRTFVATELIEGSTLRKWRQRPRSAREIAEVIAAAARGVAAGHAQGIVHGALSAESIVLEGPRVVVAGLGTPGADARADVRALGTVLYEMVHGSPPGPEPALAPRTRDLARLHRLALSLLAEGSSQASAEGLAQALAAPWGRARKIAVAASALVSVAAIFIVGYSLLGSPVRRCQAGVGLIDGLWNDGRRAELARRFAAIPAVTARWPGFARTVDEYAQRWRAAYAEVCRTGYGRRRVSGELFNRRMLCLTRRRLELEALLAGVAAATREQLASDIALTPAEATRCATINRPESKPPPSDARSRAALGHVDELLARARAQQRLGAPKAAAATAMEAVEVARAVGHNPTLAQALISQGRSLIASGVATTSRDSGFELATRILEEAYMVADRGEDDSNRLVAAGLLINAEGSRQRYPVADRWVAHAEALLARQGMPPTEASEVQTYIGYLRSDERRRPEAENAYRRALELAEKAIPQDPQRIALARQQVCHLVEPTAPRIECFRRSLATRRSVLGADNPELAADEGILAETLIRQSSTRAEGCRMYRKARATLGDTVDPSHPRAVAIVAQLAICLVFEGEVREARSLVEGLLLAHPPLGAHNLAAVRELHGYVEARHGDLGTAERELRAALAAYQSLFPPCADPTTSATDLLATVLARRGSAAEAKRLVQDRIAECEAARVESANAVNLRAALGRLLLDEGEARSAQDIFQGVLRLHTKLGTDEQQMALTLHGLGASLLALGRIEAALPVLERGYRARPAPNDSNPELRAELDFALARALRARATNRERACALGREAADVYRRMSTFARELREVERWLARESCAPAS